MVNPICSFNHLANITAVHAFQWIVAKAKKTLTTQTETSLPIGSMYAIYIYGNIYHQYTPNVSIYTIHGSYGLCIRNEPNAIVATIGESHVTVMADSGFHH